MANSDASAASAGLFNRQIEYDRKHLSDDRLRELYKLLLKPRMVEEKMLKLLRQGRISKWFSGIGQEAIAVGAASILKPEEYIFPMHRNLGVFTTRQVPLERLFGQFQGKLSGFTKGRDRSFHFGSAEHRIVGMISHLGPQLALADGVGLADKLENKQHVTVVFTGEGGTSEGDFHEALNVAAVWQLPVLFIVENNGYGLSTPVAEQFRCAQIADKGIGYGMEAHTIDGNNILEVVDTLSACAEKIRQNPQPILIECMTFRMRGHEEASGVKYVPGELMEHWAAKDPVENYQAWLQENGLLDEATIEAMRGEITAEIEQGLETAFAEQIPEADAAREQQDLFSEHHFASQPAQGPTTEKRFIDAISDGLRQAMERYPQTVLMGQDVAEYGGVFKITQGFIEQFGKERIRNTPICESAIVGAGLGLAIRNWKAIVEMQFADFVTCGFNQIVNNLAKIHYRWGQKADVVVRMPTGAGVGAGPYHSQSNEAWFFHVPGLKIVYPSNPVDAKGLLTAAIEDPNPVLYFEHKALYRSISAEVPDTYYNTEIGKAALAREGDELSIITYGMGVHWAAKALEEMAAAGNAIEADILDLRSLAPLDYEAIATTVRKTGKALVLHEDNLTGGVGAEIAAWISEHLFESLDGPVKRCASMDTPIPFGANLEKNYLASDKLKTTIEALMEF